MASNGGEEEERKEAEVEEAAIGDDADEEAPTTVTQEGETTGGETATPGAEGAVAGAGKKKKKKKKRKKKKKKGGKAEEKDQEQDEEQADMFEEEKIERKNKNDATTTKSEFPAPFYCPKTEKLMKDPVVVSYGRSYERSAVAYDDNVYPNRALKAIIDETETMSGTSIRAGMRRVEHSLRKAFSQVLDKSIIPSDEYHPLPDVYYCPITFSIIHDPVIDPEGQTYERVAIENGIRENGSSPLTRTPLTLQDLFPNNSIKDLLDLEMDHADESIHPSIRKWKEEKLPQPITTSAEDENFPTTDAQREARRRTSRVENNRNNNVFIALFFTVALLLLLLLVIGWQIFITLFCVCGLIFLMSTRETWVRVCSRSDDTLGPSTD